MQSQEFKYPNAIIRVHRPDLAEAEKQRRMNEVKLSAENLLREVIKNEHITFNTNNN